MPGATTADDENSSAGAVAWEMLLRMRATPHEPLQFLRSLTAGFVSVVFAVTLVVSTALVPACTRPEPRTDNVDGGADAPQKPAQQTTHTTTHTTTPSRLTFGITSEPSSLCPLFADGAATAELQGLLFRELVATLPGARQPDLDDAVPRLGDGAVVDAAGRLVVSWTLRDDAFWSDGHPVVANDVVAGWTIARDPTQQTTTGRDLALQIEAIDVVDARHFRVVWRGPQPSFADRRVHRVLPAHLVLNADGTAKDLARDGFCRRPIGNGAFALQEHVPGGHLLFVRNERHQPRPLLDEVLVKIVPSTDALASALRAGDVDATFPAGGLSPTEASRAVGGANHGLRLISAPGTTWIHLDFNLDDAWLKDLRLRRALAVAVDRPALAAAIEPGVDVGDTFFPRHHWARAAVPPIAFDPREAERLLDEAGWRRPSPGAIRVDARGQPLHLELAAAAGQKDTERLLQLLQAAWRDVGVDVALDLKPFKVFFGENARKRRLPHLSFYAWVVDESSMATNLWRSDKIPDEKNGWSGQNFPGWKNAEVTRLLTEVDTTLDEAVRTAKLARVQQLFVAELPALSFWFRPAVVVAGAGVDGLQPTGTLTPLAWNAAVWSKKSNVKPGAP